MPVDRRIVPFAFEESEETALQAIGSLSAWDAAIERYRLLARRGQSGAVHGTLVETDDGPMLVDESMGDGALSIAVALLDGLNPQLPMRCVLWGAWKPDATPSWRWHATRLESLPARPEPVPRVERLTPIQSERPADVVFASAASGRGGAISFVVSERSARVGDGWRISDDVGGPQVARLLLPGERETYGDQSELAGDERWKLTKNTRYWVSIRSFRAARPGELPIYWARTAPHPDPGAPSVAPARAP